MSNTTSRADPIRVVSFDPATGATLGGSANPLIAQDPRSQLATYTASGLAYTAYATPEDMLCIRGSATKIVRVTGMLMLIITTTATTFTMNFLKRSTANTGGTLTNPTLVKLDSGDPTPTAIIDLYTAVPTPGTLAGIVHRRPVGSQAPAATAVGGNFAMGNNGLIQASFLFKPPTLRGINEMFCMNWGGAALPAGFTAFWELTLTESDT